MPSAIDVAEYILHQQGEMTAMKLQKLVYYSQAWSLVWDEEPLFPEHIEAWANGPVIPELYRHHRGQFRISTIGGNPDTLNETQRETVDAVLEAYGDKSAHWLSTLTHQETPWTDARVGIADGERGSSVITHGAMADYYSNL